jgi:hypothetical protein
MARAPRYTRGFDFTDWSEDRPSEPIPGDRVDSELDTIATALNATQVNLERIQRDDGEVANQTIGLDQLKPEVRAELTAAQGADGVAGPVGPDGSQGPVGVTGPAGPALPWIVAIGAPSNAWGAIAQLYLNLSNGDVWQKDTNVWVLQGNIRGPAGVGSADGVTDHGALTGLTDPDHVIGSVQGLQAALDGLGAQLAVVGSSALRTYRQPNAPTANLNAGDLWVDTDDGNRLYRWDAISWVDVTDARLSTASAQAAAAIQAAAGAQAAVDGKITTYFLPAAPAVPRLGDLWFETDAGNLLRRYNGTTWESVQDGQIAAAILAATNAQETADGKIVSFYQTTAPIGASLGDIWIDTDDNNHLYRFNGAVWVSARDALISQAFANAAAALQAATDAEAAADGKIDVFYQANTPSGAGVGDLWIDTDDRQMYRYSGSQWVSVRDSGLVTAINDASTAINLADSKIRAFYQTSAPSGADTGDLWFDTDDNFRPYRWTGSAWQDVTPIAGVTGGQVTGVSIADGTITAQKLSVSQLSAIVANLGTITSGLLRLVSGGFNLEVGVDAGYMMWAGSGTKNDANATFYLKPDGSAFFGGNLKANSVTTTNLVAGAVSNIQAASATDATASVSGSDALNVLTVNIATTAAPVIVQASIQVQAATSNLTTPSLYVDILRNGVQIDVALIAADSGIALQQRVSLAIVDNPGAGSHTYTLRIIGTGAVAHTITASNRSLICTELRR